MILEGSLPPIGSMPPVVLPAGDARIQREHALFAAAVEGLVERGWFSCADWLAPSLVGPLVEDVRRLWGDGGFRPAEIGRGAAGGVNPDIRGDSLIWLDPANPTAHEVELWSLFERFRLHLNRELFLSLDHLELQYAAYPPGRHYSRHIDQFEGVQARQITVLLYLNPEWSGEDGGQLRIHRPPPDPAVDLLPLANTFVCFRSADIPHEVLPPRRLRFSVGGWYRIRPEIPLLGAKP